MDCVRKIGLKNFTERYKAFCRKHHYNFQPFKPEELFHASKELVAVFPKEKNYKLLIQQSIKIMSTLFQNAPADDPVYRFLDKKRSEGKPYYVYMTAGTNKFLRIYYGKVKECLRNLEQND